MIKKINPAWWTRNEKNIQSKLGIERSLAFVCVWLCVGLQLWQVLNNRVHIEFEVHPAFGTAEFEVFLGAVHAVLNVRVETVGECLLLLVLLMLDEFVVVCGELIDNVAVKLELFFVVGNGRRHNCDVWREHLLIVVTGLLVL